MMNLNGSVFWCFSISLRYRYLLRSCALEPVSGRFKQRGCELILAVRGEAFHRLDQLSFRHAEVVDQEFCVVCTGQMFEAFQVRLPIADVLIIKTVDDVFAQDKVWLILCLVIIQSALRMVHVETTLYFR